LDESHAVASKIEVPTLNAGHIKGTDESALHLLIDELFSVFISTH
jgi:hypothetical protein